MKLKKLCKAKLNFQYFNLLTILNTKLNSNKIHTQTFILVYILYILYLYSLQLFNIKNCFQLQINSFSIEYNYFKNKSITFKYINLKFNGIEININVMIIDLKQ